MNHFDSFFKFTNNYVFSEENPNKLAIFFYKHLECLANCFFVLSFQSLEKELEELFSILFTGKEQQFLVNLGEIVNLEEILKDDMEVQLLLLFREKKNNRFLFYFILKRVLEYIDRKLLTPIFSILQSRQTIIGSQVEEKKTDKQIILDLKNYLDTLFKEDHIRLEWDDKKNFISFLLSNFNPGTHHIIENKSFCITSVEFYVDRIFVFAVNTVTKKQRVFYYEEETLWNQKPGKVFSFSSKRPFFFKTVQRNNDILVKAIAIFCQIFNLYSMDTNYPNEILICQTTLMNEKIRMKIKFMLAEIDRVIQMTRTYGSSSSRSSSSSPNESTTCQLMRNNYNQILSNLERNEKKKIQSTDYDYYFAIDPSYSLINNSESLTRNDTECYFFGEIMKKDNNILLLKTNSHFYREFPIKNNELNKYSERYRIHCQLRKTKCPASFYRGFLNCKIENLGKDKLVLEAILFAFVSTDVLIKSRGGSNVYLLFNSSLFSFQIEVSEFSIDKILEKIETCIRKEKNTVDSLIESYSKNRNKKSFKIKTHSIMLIDNVFFYKNKAIHKNALKEEIYSEFTFPWTVGFLLSSIKFRTNQTQTDQLLQNIVYQLLVEGKLFSREIIYEQLLVNQISFSKVDKSKTNNTQTNNTQTHNTQTYQTTYVSQSSPPLSISAYEKRLKVLQKYDRQFQKKQEKELLLSAM